MEGMTLSGHLSNINEMMQWDFVEMFGQNFSHFLKSIKNVKLFKLHTLLPYFTQLSKKIVFKSGFCINSLSDYHKVQTLSEGHKIGKISLLFLILLNNVKRDNVKKSGRFFQNLWPSQNTWTLVQPNILFSILSFYTVLFPSLLCLCASVYEISVRNWWLHTLWFIPIIFTSVHLP